MALGSILGGVGSLLGGAAGLLGGGGSDEQTVTQQQQLPPQAQEGLNFILDQALGMAEPTTQTTFVNTPWGQFPQTTTVPGSGGLPDVVPELSDPTQQGIDQLQQGFTGPGIDTLQQTAGGDFLDANPFGAQLNPFAGMENQQAGQMNPFAFQGNDLSGVTDAITQAAQQAVGDRFSQAGRTGSPAEGLTLGRTVAQELAPFAFNARESQLGREFQAGQNFVDRSAQAEEARLGRLTGAGQNMLARGFQGFEAERGRQQQAAQQLPQLQQQEIANLLSAGDITEQQQQQELREDITALGLLSDPIIRAIGGSPMSTTQTRPLNSSTLGNVAGGALTGFSLGNQLSQLFGGGNQLQPFDISSMPSFR